MRRCKRLQGPLQCRSKAEPSDAQGKSIRVTRRGFRYDVRLERDRGVGEPVLAKGLPSIASCFRICAIWGRLKQSKQPPEMATDEIAPLGDVLSFMRLLWAVTHGLESKSKRMLSEIGVTGPQRLVLRIVGQNPNLAPGELARVLHVHPSSLTGVLHRLEQAKLLQRERDPKDGRRSTLTLTPIGRQINARRAGTVEAAVQRAMASLPNATLRSAEDVLKRLAAELDSLDGS